MPYVVSDRKALFTRIDENPMRGAQIVRRDVEAVADLRGCFARGCDVGSYRMNESKTVPRTIR